MTYTVIYEKGPTSWGAYVPDLPGVITVGDSRAEVERLIQLEWGLHQFVEVAGKLALIDPDTAKQTRLAKDFRNLIHPGRSIRKQRACDRGTALATTAAVELVSRDLQARFP